MEVQSYTVSVEHNGVMSTFAVRPLITERETEFEILKDGQLCFKLQCCTTGISDMLKLSPQFNSAGIDAGLAAKVADAVMSMGE